ncbi:MAG: hypothetical protein AAFY35_11690 [Pseudomonadota bacterium]
MQRLTRRNVLGVTVFSAAATIAAATHAGGKKFGFSDIDPSDRVPRWFSVNRFLRLSKEQVYKVDRAVRRGRGVIIEGYTRSESREIISLANKDLGAAHALLKR